MPPNDTPGAKLCAAVSRSAAVKLPMKTAVSPAYHDNREGNDQQRQEQIEAAHPRRLTPQPQCFRRTGRGLTDRSCTRPDEEVMHHAECQNNRDARQLDRKNMTKSPGKNLPMPSICPGKSVRGKIHHPREQQYCQATPPYPTEAFSTLTNQ